MKKTDPVYKSARWRQIRQLVLERDGYRCVVCNEPVAGKGEARIDHIKPRRSHPHLMFVLGNLRTLCAVCDNQAHREKGGSPERNRSGEPRVERIMARGVDLSGEPRFRAARAQSP